MKLIIVGSGTVALEPDRVCAGYYVEANGQRILLDCGPGTPHQLARFGLPWSELDLVALTHFHTDHVAGLPLLLFAMRYGLTPARTKPLRIVGPAGVETLLGRLADAFGEYMHDPGFPIVTREMADDGVLELGGDCRLRAHRTPHTEASIAYRIETAGAALGYTGDTGPAEGLAEFFAGVDLLVAECSLPDELGIESHLTPSRVADLASRARPRRLLVTHVFPQLENRDLPALIRAAGWQGPLDVARDGMSLSL